MTNVVRNTLLAVALVIGFVAGAAPLQVRVLIDADREPATGCTSDGFAGAERVVSGTVNVTAAAVTVSDLAMQRCSDGVLGAASPIVDGTGAATAGTAGTDVLAELGVPWSALDLGAEPPTIRLGYVAQLGAAIDTVFSANGGVILYPAPAGRHRVVGINGYVITVDGRGADWGGLAPLAASPAGGAAGAVHVQNVFAHANRETLWFRIDAKVVIDAPVAVDDAYTVRQGKSVTVSAPGVLINDSDPNGKPLSASVATPPEHGTLNLASDGRFTYVHDGTPAPGDSFEYSATNGTQESNKARVALTVTPDGQPDADNDNYSVAHRGTLTVPQPGVLANDSDPDGDTLRAIIGTSPRFGTLSLAQNGSFVYTHNGSNTLADSFTYRATDGTSSSASARVTITIGADQPPTGSPDAFTVAEGATLVVAAPGLLVNDADPDTPVNLLSATVATNPSHGTLTLAASGGFTYVHDGSETTGDSFTYTVGDGILTSAPVTVAITVSPVNDAPVAAADSYTTAEDTVLAIGASGVLANDGDAEGNPLTATIVANAAHGNVVLNANGSFTYTPNAKYNGADAFTYAASDGSAASAATAVAITVTAVNDAPVNAVPGPQTTAEDTPLLVPAMSVSDVDAGNSALQVALASTNGVLTVTPAASLAVSGNNSAALTVTGTLPHLNAALATLTFTPTAQYSGAAQITVATTDLGNSGAGGAQQDIDTISISVTPVDDAPVAAADSYSTDEDTPLIVSAANGVLANDTDIDTALASLTATLVANAANGNVTLNADGSFTYTPNANFAGTDAFTYHANDASGSSSDVTVTLTVTAVNDAPVITRPATASVSEDTSFAFTGASAISIADVDAAGGTLNLTLTVTGGTLNLAATPGLTIAGDGTSAITASGSLAVINVALATATYAPQADFSGSRTLTIGISDDGNTGSGGPLTDSQVVAITVTPANDAPTLALPGPQTTDEDTALVLSAANGNAIAVADVDAGTADLSVTLTALDGTITLGSTAGLTTVTGDGSSSVTLTGSVSALNAALDGTVFTPAANFASSTSINVTVDDGGNTGAGGALSSSGQFTIGVLPVNDGPSIAAPSSVMTTEDAPVTFAGANAITISDPDAGAGTLTLALSSTRGSFTLSATTGLTVSGAGTGSLTATGTLTDLNTALNGAQFTPELNYSGAASIDISIDDNGNTGSGPNLMDTTSLLVILTPVDDAPVAATDSYSVDEDAPLNVSAAAGVLGNDVDVDTAASSLTAVLVSGPSNASSFTLNADGSFAYAANANFNGTDTFTYKANDGNSDSNVVTVTITVNAVNDAPAITRPATVSTSEDTPFTFAGTISVADVDGGAGSETLTLSASGGTLTLGSTTGLTVGGNGTGSVTASGTISSLNAALNGLIYTPAAEFAGGVTLSIGLSDNGSTGTGGARSDAQVTSITITAVNDAPVNAVPGPQSTVEDSTLTLSSANANAITTSDIDAGSAEVTLTLSTANGTLTLGGTAGLTSVTGNGTGSVALTGPISAINAALEGTVFTPSANFDGPTSIVVVTNDNGNAGGGGAKSDTDTITINVTAVNDAPSITRPALATTNEDTPLLFNGGNLIAITDVDAGSGSLTVTLGATNGTLTLNAPTGLSVVGDGTSTITASGALSDLNNALNGLAYTPSLDYSGGAAVTIGVNDNGNTGTGGPLTDTKSVAITVTAQNDAPVAADDTYTTNEDTGLTVSAPGVLTNDSDVDSGSLTASVATTTTHGTLTLNADGSFTYSPNADSDVDDSFTYTATDGTAVSTTATVTIHLTPQQDPPAFTSSAVTSATEDSPYTYNVTATDPDTADTLTISAVTKPAWLTLTAGPSGTATLGGTPVNADVGSHAVTLDVFDGTTHVQQSFTIDVTNTNDAPIAVDDLFDVTEDGGSYSINDNLLTNDSDPDVGDTIQISEVNGDPNLVWDITVSAYSVAEVDGDGTLWYSVMNGSPNVQKLGQGATAVDVINYTLLDNHGATAAGALRVTIHGVNDAPVGNDDTYSLPLAGTLNATSVMANDVDVDAVPVPDVLTPTLVSSTSQGTLTFNPNGTFQYVKTCSPCALDHDSFTYKLNDGHVDSNVATVTINYNTPPTAADDAFTTNEDVPIIASAPGLQSNDTDPDGDITDVIVVSQPAVGTLTPITTTSLGDELPADGSFTYTPPPDYNGTVTFTYKLRDSNNTESAVVTVTITVNSVNDAPTFDTPAVPNVTGCSGQAAYVPGWATNISTGPSDESGQGRSFSVSVDDTSLFQDGLVCNGTSNPDDPIVCTVGAGVYLDPFSGDLTFNAKPGVSGTTTAHVYLQDDGGTANGGVNRSATFDFTVTVAPINNAPSFDGGGNVSAEGDGTVKTFTSWATNITANDPGQTVHFNVSAASDPALFTAGGAPAVSPGGTLTFTPAAEASGSTFVDITLQDDGGTTCGIDSSWPLRLFINLGQPNHPPTFTLAQNVVNVTSESSFTPIAPFVTVTGPGVGDTGQTPYSVTITGNTDPSLFSLGPLLSATSATNWRLVLQPASGKTGSATITVSVRDSGGTTFGGTDTATATFTINVGAPNHAPVLIGASSLSVTANAAPQTFTGWLNMTSPGAGDPDQSPYTATLSPTGTTNASLFSSGPTLTKDVTGDPAVNTWSLSFTPATNQTGSATFDVTVKDSGDMTFGGVNQTTRSFTISIGGLPNSAPYISTTATTINLVTSSPAQSMTNFLTVNSPGDGDPDQRPYTVTINQLTTTNPSLFSVAPSFSPNGPAATATQFNLGFTPAAAQTGTATFRITVKDSGGTFFGGTDTVTKDITISIGNVNHAPEFTLSKTTFNSTYNQSVAEPGFVTITSCGIGDPVQTPYFVSYSLVSTTNDSLFATGSVINLVKLSETSYTLNYTPAPNQVGTAVFKITVRDSGGTTYGGTDTATLNFTVNVGGVIPGVPTPTANKKYNVLAYPQLLFSITNAASDLHYRLIDDMTYTGANPPLKVQIVQLKTSSGTYANGSGPASVTVTDTTTGAFTFHPDAVSWDMSTPAYPRENSQVFTFRVCDSAPTPVCSADMNYSIDYATGSGASVVNQKVLIFSDPSAPAYPNGVGTAERPGNVFPGGGVTLPEITYVLRKGTYNVPTTSNIGVSNVVGEGFPGLSLASLGITPLPVGTFSIPTPLSTNPADRPVLTVSTSVNMPGPGTWRNLKFTTSATNPNFVLLAGTFSSGTYNLDRIQIVGGYGLIARNGATVNVTNSAFDTTGSTITSTLLSNTSATLNLSSTSVTVNCSSCTGLTSLTTTTPPATTISADSSITVSSGALLAGSPTGTISISGPVTVDKSANSEDGIVFLADKAATLDFTGPVQVTTKTGRPFVITNNSWLGSPNPAPIAPLTLTMSNASNKFAMTSNAPGSGVSGIDLLTIKVGAAGLRLAGLDLRSANVRLRNTGQGSGTIVLAGTLTGNPSSQKCVSTDLAGLLDQSALTATNCAP